jgi:hypothetical protein
MFPFALPTTYLRNRKINFKITDPTFVVATTFRLRFFTQAKVLRRLKPAATGGYLSIFFVQKLVDKRAQNHWKISWELLDKR